MRFMRWKVCEVQSVKRAAVIMVLFATDGKEVTVCKRYWCLPE